MSKHVDPASGAGEGGGGKKKLGGLLAGKLRIAAQRALTQQRETQLSQETGQACAEYVEHAFKPGICVTCSLEKDKHVVADSPTVKGQSIKARTYVKEVGFAPPVGEVCDNFVEHNFKPDICVNCNNYRSKHSEEAGGGSSLGFGAVVKKALFQAKETERAQKTGEACGRYEEHAFKKDTCVNCGMPGSSHDLSAVVSPKGAKVQREVAFSHKPAANACEAFKPHNFKPEICVTCNHAMSAHRTIAGEQGVKVEREKAFAQQPAAQVCGNFEPHQFKLEYCRHCNHPVYKHGKAASTEKGSSSKKVERETAISSQPTAQVCARFEAHSFKPQLCVHCNHDKSKHAVVAPPDPAEEERRRRENKFASIVKEAVQSKQQACDDFIEHAFRKGVCATCGLPPDKHTVKKKTAPAPVKNTACAHFTPHVFRPEQCVKCKQPRTSHMGEAPATETSQGAASGGSGNMLKALASKAYTQQVETQRADTTGQACESFKEHAFKKGTCVNCGMPGEKHKKSCQRSTGTTEPGVKAFSAKDVSVPCDSFDPHSFKPDTCVHCGHPKKSHAAPETTAPPPPPKQSSMKACSDYEQHRYKANVCANCGKTWDDHVQWDSPRSAEFEIEGVDLEDGYDDASPPPPPGEDEDENFDVEDDGGGYHDAPPPPAEDDDDDDYGPPPPPPEDEEI